MKLVSNTSTEPASPIVSSFESVGGLGNTQDTTSIVAFGTAMDDFRERINEARKLQKHPILIPGTNKVKPFTVNDIKAHL